MGDSFRLAKLKKSLAFMMSLDRGYCVVALAMHVYGFGGGASDRALKGCVHLFGFLQNRGIPLVTYINQHEPIPLLVCCCC